jgi:hypothetical protein
LPATPAAATGFSPARFGQSGKVRIKWLLSIAVVLTVATTAWTSDRKGTRRASATTAPATTTTTTSAAQRAAKLLIADPNGFAGYTSVAKVREIAATWTVPTIDPRSAPGYASTWVGAADSNRNFIQIGTLENMVGEPDAGLPIYRAFWSDAAVEYHPQDLGFVEAGDVVHAEMVQHADGWELRITDTTHALRHDWNSHYGGDSTFTLPQWYQEDPSVSSAARDLPYPTMSSVALSDLKLNDHAPALLDADAHTIVSPNGVVLVPTRIADNSFRVVRANPMQAQYLLDVGPPNAASNVIVDALRLGHSANVRADTDDFIAKVETLDTNLAAQTWPFGIRAGLGALIRANQGALPALRAFARSSDPTLEDLAVVLDAQNQASRAGVMQIRQGLALPPS